jgi:hypothetical protein
MAITTGYVFRGISRSRRCSALQVGLDGSFTLRPVDLFIGAVCASNVALDRLEIKGARRVFASGEEVEDGDSDGDQVELDLCAGVSGELPMGDGIDWDADAIYYAFCYAFLCAAHSSDHDFIEVFLGLSCAFLDAILEPEPEVGASVY